MKYRIKEITTSVAGAEPAYTTAYDFGGCGGDSISVTVNADVDTPGAKTFASTAVDVTANTITITAHGYTEGLKGQFTTDGGLPTGISASTDYFIIVVDANTVKVATSLANAQAGTAVDITGQGTGNDTFTPTAIAGGSIKLQQTNALPALGLWADLGSATNITADGVIYLSADRPTARWIRVYQTLTAGHITSAVYILIKGDRDV